MSADPPGPPLPGDLEKRASVRHDLRTPLNQILGYSELLADEALASDCGRIVPDLEKIQFAAHRLLGMIDVLFGASVAPVEPDSPEGIDLDETGVLWKETDVDSSGAQGAHPAPAGRLLVVDDNVLNLDMLSRRLKSRGYDVKVARNGPSALQAIAEHEFDAVLLDVVMPGMDGLQVLETIRRTHSVADLPVIMATSRDGSNHIVEAMKLGANDYVTKPLDFPVVRARLKNQLLLKEAKDRLQKLSEELELRNRFITQTFGRYLSEDVVTRLLESPGGLLLGGERRTVTMLMSDLRGFSTLSERLSPEQVVRLLNNYLGAMAEIVAEHRGMVDEFVGDAILAIFGAPLPGEGDAERGVACAIAMQLAMESVNAQNESEGLPAIEMGIAVHTGEVVLGNIGSQKRTKYGIVGSHVNLTARIESDTVGGQILISSSCLASVGPICEVGRVLEMRAKGFADSITAHEVRSLGGRYGLKLPIKDTRLVHLTSGVPIRFWILSDKQVGETTYEGEMTALSPFGAEIRSARRLRALSNVLVRVGSTASGPGHFDFYAKAVDTSGPLGFEIRFTSIAPDALGWLKSLPVREQEMLR